MFKKLFITVGALVALAVPSAAMADASPSADYWTFKNDVPTLPATSNGQDSAQILHNGWSVGGNKHYTGSDSVYSGGDQTTEPGSRAVLSPGHTN